MEPLDDMIEGDREFALDDGRILVFKPHSTIQIYESKDAEEPLATFDPAVLSMIYGAYRQMMSEIREVNRAGK